ncbi:hypothetical protein [Umezawaea sp. Da 62-37]|uniref:hypothetical protein n=1 Tax=Umezawaea sp. Da 62-37 TaxID=3075927 RepID=UPI0028F735BF|nr:hypothetical protein [Umezawaea sp. Da 62-37]WNV83227.1 hypothetical protein RM788_34285 [Umezawaea sp. Da 62-37]
MTTPRQAAVTFTAIGLLFLAYPLIRPYDDETTMAGALSFAGDSWIAAHMAAVIGFILLPMALTALSPSRAAQLMTYLGVGLTLPYYGAEVFGLHAIGEQIKQDGDLSLLAMVDTIRYNPAAMTIFALGLVLIAAGTTTAAIRHTSTLPGWTAAPFALGFVLFIPQFFTPAPFRIAHGFLIAAGSAWLAVELWRNQTLTPASAR